MDCNPLGSSVHRVFQARILEWVAISHPRGSSQTWRWNPNLSHLLHWQMNSFPQGHWESPTRSQPRPITLEPLRNELRHPCLCKSPSWFCVSKVPNGDLRLYSMSGHVPRVGEMPQNSLLKELSVPQNIPSLVCASRVVRYHPLVPSPASDFLPLQEQGDGKWMFTKLKAGPDSKKNED